MSRPSLMARVETALRGWIHVDDPTLNSGRFDLGSLNGMLGTRRVTDIMLSDGATSNRHAEDNPGAPGNMAGLPMHGHAHIYKPSAAAACCIFGFAPLATALPSTQANALGLELTAGGALTLRQTGADVAVNFRNLGYAGFFAALSAGWHLLTWDFAAGDSTTNPVLTLDGVDFTASFTLTYGSGGVGAAPNWQPTTLDCTKRISYLNMPAGMYGECQYGPGAWTVAECLAYAQTGRKPIWWTTSIGSAVALVTGDNSTFASDTGYWTKTGGATIAAGVASFAGGGSASAILRDTFFTPGRWYVLRLKTATAGIWRIGWAKFADVGIADKTVASGPAGIYYYAFQISPTATGSTERRLGIWKNDAGAGELDSLELFSPGPAATHALQPGCACAPDNGTNGLPLLLTSGMSVAGDLPAQVTVQGLSMTADGYVLADQVLTDSRYALTKVSVTQTGTTTNALTARVDSSGGTTVASGALSATAKRVALTLTADAESAGGKKVHLSGIAGATITPVLTYTRSA